MSFAAGRSRGSSRQRIRILPLLFCLLCSFSHGSSDYYSHVIFDNSLTSDYFFYSAGRVSGQSFLEEKNHRLPIETKTFLTPPNAIRLQWQSAPGGSWIAEIKTTEGRNRAPGFSGHNLYFWIFSPQPISADDMPQIVLSTANEGLQVAEFPGRFSDPLDLGKYSGDLPAGRWVQVRIPLSDCRTASIYRFPPEYLQNVIFHQGRADGARHTLIVDEIRVDNDPPAATTLAAPSNVRAVGYDRHVEIEWDDAVEHQALARYVIYRSLDGNNFSPVGIHARGKELVVLSLYARQRTKEIPNRGSQILFPPIRFRKGPDKAVGDLRRRRYRVAQRELGMCLVVLVGVIGHDQVENLTEVTRVFGR